MNREEARNHLAEWLDEKMWRCFGTIDREALRMAVEALLILDESGIVNCCGCIHWNEYGFCNLTDKRREDFDYCSDGRRKA